MAQPAIDWSGLPDTLDLSGLPDQPTPDASTTAPQGSKPWYVRAIDTIKGAEGSLSDEGSPQGLPPKEPSADQAKIDAAIAEQNRQRVAQGLPPLDVARESNADDKFNQIRSEMADEAGRIASLGADSRKTPPAFTSEQIEEAASKLDTAKGKQQGDIERGVTDSVADQISGLTNPETPAQLGAGLVTIPAFVLQRILSLPEQAGRIEDASKKGGAETAKAITNELLPDLIAASPILHDGRAKAAEVETPVAPPEKAAPVKPPLIERVSPETGERFLIDPDSGEVVSRQVAETSGRAVKAIGQSGGVTIDLSGNEPKSGYAFAPSKDTETTIPEDDFSEQSIQDFSKANAAALSEPGAHIGGWRDGKGNIVLDVSNVSDNLHDALVKAKAANQDAIFDLGEGKEINVAEGLAQLSPEEVGAAEQRSSEARVSRTGDSRKPSGLLPKNVPTNDRGGNSPQPQDASLGTSNRAFDDIYGDGEIAPGEGRSTEELLQLGRARLRSGKYDPYKIATRARSAGAIRPEDYAVLAAEHDRLYHDAMDAAREAEDSPTPANQQRASELHDYARDFAQHALQPHKTTASDLFRAFQEVQEPRLDSMFGVRDYFRSQLGREIRPDEEADMRPRVQQIKQLDTTEKTELARAGKRVGERLKKVREISIDEAGKILNDKISEALKDCNL
jgi:hypothetical protein